MLLANSLLFFSFCAACAIISAEGGVIGWFNSKKPCTRNAAQPGKKAPRTRRLKTGILSQKSVSCCAWWSCGFTVWKQRAGHPRSRTSRSGTAARMILYASRRTSHGALTSTGMRCCRGRMSGHDLYSADQKDPVALFWGTSGSDRQGRDALGVPSVSFNGTDDHMGIMHRNYCGLVQKTALNSGNINLLYPLNKCCFVFTVIPCLSVKIQFYLQYIAPWGSIEFPDFIFPDFLIYPRGITIP